MKSQFEITEEIYATHGQRFANLVIDYFCQLVLLFGVVFAYIFVCVLQGSTEIPDFERLGKLGQYILGLVLLLIYYNLFEILFARTVAKFITNTVVVDQFGEKPTANAILMRSICRAIPLEFFTFLGIPCRGWHDSFSDTYVVQKDLLDEARKRFYSFEEIGESKQV